MQAASTRTAPKSALQQTQIMAPRPVSHATTVKKFSKRFLDYLMNALSAVAV